MQWSTLVVVLAVLAGWLLTPRHLFAYPRPVVRGQHVVVTGASQGIGLALVDQYAQAGAAAIVMVSRSHEKLEKIRGEVMAAHPATQVHVVSADLSSEKACREAMAAALAICNGRLDVLLLNHITNSRFGLYLNTVRKGEGIEFVEKMFAANAMSYIWLATHAISALTQSGGSIGVVSSLAGHVGTPKTAVYSCTRGDLVAMFLFLHLVCGAGGCI